MQNLYFFTFKAFYENETNDSHMSQITVRITIITVDNNKEKRNIP